MSETTENYQVGGRCAPVPGPAIRHTGYYAVVEERYRWLTAIGNSGTTDYFENRGHWPTAEEAQKALDEWLDANPQDPAYARLRPNTEVSSGAENPKA